MKLESQMTTRRGLRLEFFSPQPLTHENEQPVLSGARNYKSSEQRMNDLLLRRYASAANPLGRWKLQLELASDRVLWHCLVDGARIVKRAFDVLASLLLLIILSPVFLLIA